MVSNVGILFLGSLGVPFKGEVSSLIISKPRDMLTSKEGLILHVFGQILAYFGTFTQVLFISSRGR